MAKEQVINELGIQIESRPENEYIIPKVVCDFLEMYTLKKEAEEVMAAVSEAVDNCIEHAYSTDIGVIDVSLKIFDNGKVRVKIKDKGCGIEDIERAQELLFTSNKEYRSGLGFTIMADSVDKLKIKSTVGKGTTVILEKKIEFYS